jgi:hypothetical protein
MQLSVDDRYLLISTSRYVQLYSMDRQIYGRGSLKYTKLSRNIIFQKDCGCDDQRARDGVAINVRILFSTCIVASSFVALIRTESHACSGRIRGADIMYM